jgi:2'-5' RNA ligase
MEKLHISDKTGKPNYLEVDLFIRIRPRMGDQEIAYTDQRRSNMLRSIILFPTFPGLERIQSIRKKYDPLAYCIPPHITVVFPFDSNLTTHQIQQHLTENLFGIKRFGFMLSGFSKDFRNGYIFLNVKKGNAEIIQIHDLLYSGFLKKQLVNRLPYKPHLTVGRLKIPEEINRAIDDLLSNDDCFEGIIDRVYVERIDEQENSIIELCQALAQ